DLPGHDPSVPLGGALPEDLRMTDLFRQCAHERGLARHVDGRPGDAHRDPVTDPRRVRILVRPAHACGVAAVTGRRPSSEALHERDFRRIAVLVERMYSGARLLR